MAAAAVAACCGAAVKTSCSARRQKIPFTFGIFQTPILVEPWPGGFAISLTNTLSFMTNKPNEPPQKSQNTKNIFLDTFPFFVQSFRENNRRLVEDWTRLLLNLTKSQKVSLWSKLFLFDSSPPPVGHFSHYSDVLYCSISSS